MKEDTLYKNCISCNKYLPVSNFERVSRHSGLKEKGFVYCNKCANYKEVDDLLKTTKEEMPIKKKIESQVSTIQLEICKLRDLIEELNPVGSMNIDAESVLTFPMNKWIYIGTQAGSIVLKKK